MPLWCLYYCLLVQQSMLVVVHSAKHHFTWQPQTGMQLWCQ